MRRQKNVKERGRRSSNTKRVRDTTEDNNLQLLRSPFDFTEKQLDIIDAIETPNEHMTLLGYAGTAKTSTALYGAFAELEKQKYKNIIVIRSAVQGRDIGFTPGTEQEKAAVYEKPYITISNMLYGRGDAYGILKKKNILQFELTSFLRGETFDNSIVIVDEVQNMEASELSTVITRLGINSKLIICGDVLNQRDLKNSRERNVEKVLNILYRMESFTHFIMGIDDIVRSGFVREYIIKQMELYPQGLS